MSEVIGGIVKRITERETKLGTMYSILLQEDDGSETWVGWGKYPPKFGEGSEIEFEATFKGDYVNAVAKTVDIIEMVKPKQQSRGRRGNSEQSGSRRGGSNRGGDSARGSGSSRAGNAKQSGGDKPKVDWDRKDKIIQWQSCRNSAIAVLELALKADALPLPAKKAEKLDALVGAVDELTAQFFKDNNESPFQEAKPKQKPMQVYQEEDYEYIPADHDDEDDGLPGDE